MKSGWFFGDSFTVGTGCTPNSVYYENYPLERKKFWPELISEEFGFNMKNRGIEGGGSPIILHNICKTLPEIKKNDLVVLSGSLVNRLPLVNRLSKEPPYIETVNTGVFNKKAAPTFDPKIGKNEFFKDKDAELTFLKFCFNSGNVEVFHATKVIRAKAE